MALPQMKTFILMVTWFYYGQPPATSHAEFSSSATARNKYDNRGHRRGCEMATNHVRFSLAPRRFHLVAGHGSRRVHIGERVLRFFHERMSGGSRPTWRSCRSCCDAQSLTGSIL